MVPQLPHTRTRTCDGPPSLSCRGGCTPTRRSEHGPSIHAWGCCKRRNRRCRRHSLASCRNAHARGVRPLARGRRRARCTQSGRGGQHDSRPPTSVRRRSRPHPQAGQGELVPIRVRWRRSSMAWPLPVGPIFVMLVVPLRELTAGGGRGRAEACRSQAGSRISRSGTQLHNSGRGRKNPVSWPLPSIPPGAILDRFGLADFARRAGWRIGRHAAFLARPRHHAPSPAHSSFAVALFVRPAGCTGRLRWGGTQPWPGCWLVRT